jgi:hypothetical protein
VIEALSKCLAMPIFSDDFDSPALENPHPPMITIGQGSRLAQGLDALCTAYGRLWWVRDGTLFFRSRTWYIEKTYQTPQRTLVRLWRELARPGDLTPSAATVLSSLTLRQLQGLGVTLRAHGYTGFNLVDEMVAARTLRDYLEVCASLNEGQKRAALSKDGLPLQGMSEAQKRQMLALVILQAQRAALDRLPEVRLRIRREGGPSSDSVLSDSGTPPLHLAVVAFSYLPRFDNILRVPWQMEESSTQAGG